MNRREFLGTGLALALRQTPIERAVETIRQSTASGDVAAAVLHIQQGNRIVHHHFGAAQSPDTVFLLASISKPITAAAVMVLFDLEKLALEDPVSKHIPEFRGGDRALVTVKHLLTHTSGLPDMLPENEQLRKRHAPLSDFVSATCRTPLLFRPGTEVRYQSMGILLAAEIVERITRSPLRMFLRRTVFDPLDMKNSSLGLGGRKLESLAQCQVGGNHDWNWNSPYWRDLGAPWGGVHSTAADVASFVRFFFEPAGHVVRKSTASLMTAVQTEGLAERWGLGWMRQPGTFGKQCSDATYGHHGSTGTVAWLDPSTGTSMVLLTTKPADRSRASLLGPVSDLVSEAARATRG